MPPFHTPVKLRFDIRLNSRAAVSTGTKFYPDYYKKFFYTKQMTTKPLLRLAVWSGPRNISTAMMRSWENRSDTCVVDEPLYAHYLKSTGIDHPMAEAVIASQSTNWQGVTHELTLHAKAGYRIYYQKHISTHLLQHMDLQWCKLLINCLLIREPEKVVASYARKRVNLQARDLGYDQLLQVYEYLRTLGQTPIVIDTDRFLQDPQTQLETWCARLDIPFDNAMLNWPPGTRNTDGVWAAHWYDAVEKSTGFAPHSEVRPKLNARQQAVASQCRAAYDKMLDLALD